MTNNDAPLDNKLQRADAIQAAMMKLLQDLEQTATGKTVSKPGGWRQHPSQWAGEHLPAPGDQPPI